MFDDDLKMNMNITNTKNELKNYTFNKEVEHFIKDQLEDEKTRYYPLGGFTNSEISQCRLYPYDEHFYCRNLIIGEIEGVRYRKATIQYMYKYYDDGAIRKDAHRPDKVFDSILYEFSFDNIFVNNLLIGTEPNDFEHKLLQKVEDQKYLKDFDIYEEYLAYRRISKTKVALTTVSILAGRLPLNNKLTEYTYQKNNAYTIDQILNNAVIESIHSLHNKYKGITFSFKSNSLFIKLADTTIFNENKLTNNTLQTKDIDTANAQLEDFKELLQSLSKDAFITPDAKRGDQ